MYTHSKVILSHLLLIPTLLLLFCYLIVYYSVLPSSEMWVIHLNPQSSLYYFLL